ncbi:hypothetical protein ACFCVO_09775 [Agromyces sp. NPDC056379]|uniref:hypothetical protein n=1 Tax=unclassified Agromyces TaxID=2639701 RepID=UPI0035D91F20
MTISSRVRPHPTEGWDERRAHLDGVSYWRRGERHRTLGWAVDRDGAREAWLYGHRIPTPDHAPTDPLSFAGQSRSGELRWADGEGTLRVVCSRNAAGVDETRFLDRDGEPERHWRHGHQLTRELCTGERRHYERHAEGWRLHRIGGPAIEDAGSALRCGWFEHGEPVESLQALLSDARALAVARYDAGRDPMPHPLDAAQFARIAAYVASAPDGERSWELSIAFPTAWAAGMRAAGLLDR